MQMWVAYAWLSGVIQIGHAVPEGATHIISGRYSQIQRLIKTTALHHTLYGQKYRIVPDFDESQPAGPQLLEYAERLELLRNKETHHE